MIFDGGSFISIVCSSSISFLFLRLQEFSKIESSSKGQYTPQKIIPKICHVTLIFFFHKKYLPKLTHGHLFHLSSSPKYECQLQPIRTLLYLKVSSIIHWFDLLTTGTYLPETAFVIKHNNFHLLYRVHNCISLLF